jgi:transketolase
MPQNVQEKTDQALVQRAINAVRALAIDATEAAGSGHPGMPLGSAPMGYLLYGRFMRFNPKNPTWPNRDRYVQSAGHGSSLQYALLHLSGFDLPMEQLRRHRQWGSITPGHPENFLTPGVETTTGPLGQGISTAVGMALAEAHMAAVYNRPGFEIFNHYTYVIAGDGDLMEGVSAEASSLAGHLGLGKLIVLYDDNNVTIDGQTHITFTEDVLKRYEAYGWHTLRVDDGNDITAIEAALHAAKANTGQPSIIAVKTIIGYGAPKKEGTSKAHGEVLGPDEAKTTKERLGIDWPAFTVPSDVQEHYRAAAERGAQAEQAWLALLEGYRTEHPDLAAQLERVMADEIPADLADKMPRFEPGKSIATRNASHKVLNAIAPHVPQLVGGSADLAGSNKTTLTEYGFMQSGNYEGRNIHFGVREHAMAAIGNGLSLHKGLRSYVATFLIFSDYLRPSLRLSALMGEPVTYVLTHDSVGLGGDGPTHQPVEHLMSLRAIPGLTVLRPADGNETAQAWQVALEQKDGPSVLALTRQDVPNLDVPQGSVAKGAYVLADSDGTPDVILIGTGSEVHPCLAAKDLLEQDGIKTRVVSMPSFELFEAQDETYRASVLPSDARARVAVEAGVSLGWQKYVGTEGAIVGIDRFGTSAEGEEILERFGFTGQNVADTARKLLK